jgi:hypothetical protein
LVDELDRVVEELIPWSHCALGHQTIAFSRTNRAQLKSNTTS